MSSSSTQKQQQRYRINYNSEQSRNKNAYFDREDYHRRSFFKKTNYWNGNFHRSYDDFHTNHYYQYRNLSHPLSFRRQRKERQVTNEHWHNTKSAISSLSSKNSYSYYENIPPRHRLQKLNNKLDENPIHLQESKSNVKTSEFKSSNSVHEGEQQLVKPVQSISSTSTNSDSSNNVVTNHRKDLHAKNLAATTAALAARQQNSSQQTNNLGMVQALMNSLILQQQQPSNSQSTTQLQCQLTNALVGIMIQQRLKEAALQAQAQHIQATLPTLLAAQALVYQQQQQQQQGQLTASTQHQVQSIIPPSIAHPGTKFNNRPLVKFPVIRPPISSLSPAMIMPTIRPAMTTNVSRHRLSTHTQQMCSTTSLPTYQQVQEIERGMSLDEAIHLKNAIDIAHINETSNNVDTVTTSPNNIVAE